MSRGMTEEKKKRLTSLVVQGGYSLIGRVDVEGNKNSALPLLAACLLTEESCVLTNVPRITDVQVMVDLLSGLGADVSGVGTPTVRVCCAQVVSDEPDRRLVGRLRGSVLLCGPLLARLGRVRLAPPGGDFPARRTLAAHLQALEAMGVRRCEDTGGDYVLEAPDGLRPASVYLEEASVTGTETALLAAAAAPGESEIRHAACEPHVVELCQFLTSIGAEVEGAGTSTIRITGGGRLTGTEHRLNGDYIEAGSWIVAAAVSGGELEVCGARADHLEPITSVLKRMRVDCQLDDDRVLVRPSSAVGIPQITTAPWPGFPSDMVSLISVLATQATGRTLIHDWMYELRLFALEQLSGMGANLFLCDPHRMIVNGSSPLTGRTLDSRDLRSGMALIAAALAATGTSRIHPLETVERGYSRLVERLLSLGAKVEVEDA
jgi:UDP-N-acetylglucosamine 1-carboxyvinyltransferase